MSVHKLYMVLVGGKPNGRHMEQHDVFFGIAMSLKELKQDIENFWPEAKGLHIDAWREVNWVDGCKVQIYLKSETPTDICESTNKLFFVNLGGYQPLKFEEQHEMFVTAQTDLSMALKHARRRVFYKNNKLKGAPSHIDDQYGLDVDELYEIEEILVPDHKARYKIWVAEKGIEKEDEIHLGYLKLSKL